MVAALEAILVLGPGSDLPSWALVVIPFVAAIAGFFGAERLRAVSRQRRRRARATRSCGRGIREPAAPHSVTAGRPELGLVPARADEGGYQR